MPRGRGKPLSHELGAKGQTRRFGTRSRSRSGQGQTTSLEDLFPEFVLARELVITQLSGDGKVLVGRFRGATEQRAFRLQLP